MMLQRGMNEEEDTSGALGRYGAVIVPPGEEGGSWLVALAAWDDGAEGYVSSTVGPLVETREEAMEQAQRVLNWLETQREQGDLMRIWEQMQGHLGAAMMEQPWPPSYDPWGRLIR